MTPQRIVVASQNPDKIREVESVIAQIAPSVGIVRGLKWPPIAETEPTLEGNALLKAKAVLEATGVAALADDTGLEVAALDGAPGVHTARYAGPLASYEENVEHLLRVMENEKMRDATFRTVVALVDADGTVAVAEGHLDGRIGRRRRGDGGFGYDPVFVVETRSLAEMGEKEKDRMSHRALALRALVEKVWIQP